MNDFGSSLGILNVFWQYVVYPAFHVIQTAKFAGVALITILLGFFFIRLSYRYLIIPLVGSGDRLTDKATEIRDNQRRRRELYERERRKAERRK